MVRRKGDPKGKRRSGIMVESKEDFVVSVEEQVEFAKSVIESVDLVAILEDVQEDAKKLAMERLVEFAPVYGDGNFHKTVAALRQEQVEEAADAVNYEIFKLYRKSRGLA